MSNSRDKLFFIKPLLYVTAVLSASYLVLYIEKLRPSDFGFYKDIFSKEIVIKKTAEYPLRKPSGKLTEEEIQFAKTAWKYFENNYQESTGFVNSVHLYPSTTLWDLTSYLMGLVSAREIGIIDSAVFDRCITKCLQSLSQIKLYKNVLPNKVYNSQNLQMTDYNNYPTEEGVGWSAMDIGRFFSFVSRITYGYPQYTPLIKNVISRWKINEMIFEGKMHGMVFSSKDKTPRLVQEGKLGYEEYCAKGLSKAGYDVSDALLYTDFIRFVEIYDDEIGVDTREVKYSPAYNYILSEPYLLDGIEHGWDLNSSELAFRIYKVQKERFAREKILTAVSEDHLDQPPYFVYNSVYADGKALNCIAENGDVAPQFKTLSTKAAFAWYVLYDDDYASKLFDEAKKLYDAEKGWYAGKYEQSGLPNKAITANTNGIILECLNYKMKGKLVGM